MSLNDELDDILREFAKAQGIKMEEVTVQPLPKLTPDLLPPLPIVTGKLPKDIIKFIV